MDVYFYVNKLTVSVLFLHCNKVTKHICVFFVFVGDVDTVTGVHAAFSNTLLCTWGCAHEFPPEQPCWNKGEPSFFFSLFELQKKGVTFLLRHNYSCSLLFFFFYSMTLDIAIYYCIDQLFSSDMSAQLLSRSMHLFAFDTIIILHSTDSFSKGF